MLPHFYQKAKVLKNEIVCRGILHWKLALAQSILQLNIFVSIRVQQSRLPISPVYGWIMKPKGPNKLQNSSLYLTSLLYFKAGFAKHPELCHINKAWCIILTLPWKTAKLLNISISFEQSKGWSVHSSILTSILKYVFVFKLHDFFVKPNQNISVQYLAQYWGTKACLNPA